MKVTGLAKRRTIAKALCDAQRVWINGRQAKASAEVKVGDVIEIQWGTHRVTARVLAIPHREVPRSKRMEYIEMTSQRLGLEACNDNEHLFTHPQNECHR